MQSRRTVASLGGALCLGGAAFGAVGLAGWLAGLPALAILVPGQPPMMPNTALSLLFMGTAGVLRRDVVGGWPRIASLCMGMAVLAIAVATLAEYAFAVDLHIDQIVVRSEEGPYPGRMSPFTAAALASLACALLVLDTLPAARARPSEWLTILSLLIAFTASMGQVFGAPPLYRLESASVIGVAVPTASSIILISVGLLLARPDRGVMRLLTSDGPGGALFRRLAIPAVLAPVVVGVALSRLLAALALHEFASAYATLAVGATVVGLSLLMITAAPLNRAQEKVRQTMERFELALRGADLGSWDWDLGSGEVTFNARWAEMRGKALSHIEPSIESWKESVHPEDWLRVAAALRNHLEGHTATYELERRAVVESGQDMWVLERGRVFARDERGRPTRMVVTQLDVTRRRLAEQSVRLSEAKYSGIVSLSSDAIISIDAHSHITLFNEGAEEIFGYSREEILGAPIDLLIPERFREAHHRHVADFLSRAESSRRVGHRGRTIWGLRKNGQEFPADASISKLQVGDTMILTVSLQDASERVRRESQTEMLADLGRVLNAAEGSNEALERIAELTVHGLADACILEIHDETEGPERHVVVRDPEKAWARELLVRPSPRAEPEPEPESAGSVFIDEVSEEVLARLAGTEERLRGLRALAPRGIIAVALVARGRLLGTLTLLSSNGPRPFGRQDVTFAEEFARRAALGIDNARLYRAAKRAIRARDDVLGIVAHDLRNPLGVILMEAQLLQRDGQWEPLREDFDRIIRAARRMHRLTEDLLDVTRVDAGRLLIDAAQISPYQVLSELIATQAAAARAKSIELRLEAPTELPSICADRNRILQVLENLVGNAIKFTRPNDRIVVGAVAHPDETLFWVSDTGMGIPAEDVPHVFDRFWQRPETRRTGAGLGLAIVKGIVEAHGGRVWVESEVGHGTTFFFTIPASADANAPPRTTSDVRALGSAKHVATALRRSG